ncbi:plasminogen-like [Dreissena polymorpha]|uniref:Kringle domain-containing protein n=1 Tax=Dreissena polymorpha TaxID=45954 RepID=A0A9D4LIE4_DREPO|nr:plasminogen-like [Dreissena polymorpha]KAH3858339.1 hypothetical protein DPMN_100962 [Dreissena polymorpha]
MDGFKLVVVTTVILCLYADGIYGQCFYTGLCYTEHDKGVSYRGHVATGVNGSACVPWNRHLHHVTPDRFQFEGLEANYCRNPRGSRSAPWCYTAASGNEEDSWQLCSVPLCEGCIFRGVNMKEGDKFHDGCSVCVCQANGIRCLDCPGPVFTNTMGCYVRYNQTEHFPRCCPKIVCYAKDAEFNLNEYFDYLKKVLPSRVEGPMTSSVTSAPLAQQTPTPQTSSANNILP